MGHWSSITFPHPRKICFSRLFQSLTLLWVLPNPFESRLETQEGGIMHSAAHPADVQTFGTGMDGLASELLAQQGTQHPHMMLWA